MKSHHILTFAAVQNVRAAFSAASHVLHSRGVSNTQKPHISANNIWCSDLYAHSSPAGQKLPANRPEGLYRAIPEAPGTAGSLPRGAPFSLENLRGEAGHFLIVL